MALSQHDIAVILAKKGMVLDPSSPPYKNLKTALIIKCTKKHLIQTDLQSVRSEKFVCPRCAGDASRQFSNKITEVPVKKGYRIIGLDNATERMGVSIFDNGKLVYYNLAAFRGGDYLERLSKIRDWIEDVVIPKWKPDFLSIEDAQLEKSHMTYAILLKLGGIIQLACHRAKIPCEKARANVWRSHFGINGRGREVNKQKAIKLVAEMYGIKVNDDIAEAILIGKYRVDKKKIERKPIPQAF